MQRLLSADDVGTAQAGVVRGASFSFACASSTPCFYGAFLVPIIPGAINYTVVFTGGVQLKLELDCGEGRWRRLRVLDPIPPLPACADSDKHLDHVDGLQRRLESGQRQVHCDDSIAGVKPFAERQSLNAELMSIHATNLNQRPTYPTEVLVRSDGH